MTLDSRMVAEIAGGSTVVGLALARHMPAPVESSVFYRWVFDSIQDLCKNNDRIGQVRIIKEKQNVTNKDSSGKQSPASLSY